MTLKFISTYAIVSLAALCFSCSNSQKFDANATHYKKFDIFTLSGFDTLSNSMIMERQNLEFVDVSYSNGLPEIITYHFPDREVVLELETTLKFESRNVYVYYTGNLLGGKAGKQREYSLHSIDNGYRLYIDLSDTLLVKRFDNIDARSGEQYHYMVDVYTKKGSEFYRYYLLQDDTNNKISKDSLYELWAKELKIFKPKVISTVDMFPPK